MTLVKKIKDKKVNFEFNKEFIKVVTDKIAKDDVDFITNSFIQWYRLFWNSYLIFLVILFEDSFLF